MSTRDGASTNVSPLTDVPGNSVTSDDSATASLNNDYSAAPLPSDSVDSATGPDTPALSTTSLRRPKSAPALMVGGRRVFTADKLRPLAADKSDWMLDRTEFSRLNAQYGPFTVDAACDTNGYNSHVSGNYFSSANSFLNNDVSGQAVWCNPPFRHATEFLTHYLSCKSHAPTTTSGMFILPKWDKWAHLTKHMTLVHEYPARTQLFTKPVSSGSPERTFVGPTPWPIQVFYDPPAATVEAALASMRSDNPACSTLRHQPTPIDPSPLLPPSPDSPPPPVSPVTEQITNVSAPHASSNLLVLVGRHRGRIVKVLVDSGASRDFISAAAVKRLGLAMSPLDVHLKVRLADGSLSTSAMQVTFPLELPPALCETRSFVVTSLDAYDIILGKTWLTDHNPVIDWVTNTITSPFKLSGATADDFRPTIQHLRATKMAKLLVRPGVETYLVNLEAVSPPSSTDTDPLKPATCLSAAGQSALHNLLDRFRDTFSEPTGVHERSGVYHKIPLKDGATLPQQRTRQMSPAELAEVQRQLTWYLERGWIRPSDSAFGAPIVFAKKADGTLRFCVDYRALNNITKQSFSNLPRISEALDQLNGAKYFTSIDLSSGYHQVPMAPEDIHKTAFSTRYGNYEFTVMPFGLCSAPHTFQALMNNVLKDFVDKFVLVYLDDVLIYSRSEREHLQHVESVMQALQGAKLHCKLSKCRFARDTTIFLGFQVSRDGISMDPKKVAAILNWSVPSTLTEVRAFLGFAGFYRRFIRNFSTIAAPLTSLTSATKPFPPKLPADAVDAFHRLKTAVTTAPVLKVPDTGPEATFELYTDASLVGIGAVLEQDGQPVCFESRKLNPAERNYPIHELELLAVVHSLRAFRHYLEGCKQFVLYTDHHSIKYIFTQKDLSRRQARWLTDLADFQPNMEIAYKPGKLNRADALSRHISDLNLLTSFTISSDTLLSDIKSAYSSDPFYSDSNRPTYLRLHNDLWLFNDRICVPNSPTIRTTILRDYHDAPSAGHSGYLRTLNSIASHFWWPRMTRTVRAYVSSCATCQRTKPSTQSPAGLLRPHAVPDRPWSHISMDLITDLPRSTGPDGVVYDSIATFVDLLTKQAFFVRTNKTVTAQGLAHLYIDNVYRLKGLSKFIISDRDTRITSDFWQTLFKRLGTTLNLSSAAHPQTDGQTERTHRTIEQILRAYVDPHHDDWALWLPVAEFAYNNSVHSTTTVTPFMASYGYEPYTPATISLSPSPDSSDYADKLRDLHAFIIQQSQAAKTRMVDSANKSRRDVTFHVGDKVRVTTQPITIPDQPSTKLRHRYIGPFTVTEVISPVSYRLRLSPGMRMHDVFHVSRLAAWSDSDPSQFPGRIIPPPPPATARDFISGDDVFLVDRLLDCRILTAPTKAPRPKKTLQFLVKWSAPYQDPSHDSWEPFANLQRLDAFKAFISGPVFAAFSATAEYKAFAAQYPRIAAQLV